MNKKSFFLGVVTGIVLTFAGLIVIGYVNQNEYDPIQYLEQPVSYENKTETSFQVFQVLSLELFTILLMFTTSFWKKR